LNPSATATPTAGSGGSPARAGLVLFSLILAAAVANLNLAVANVALPEIGMAFDASQTSLNLVAVGYSLGLAASVLYLGAVGDRYGRKMLLLIGTGLSIPIAVLAALSPTIEILFAARVLGGIAAGMAFPTTLALITALWSGQPRTRAIALWSATGGGVMALGPVAAGAVLTGFPWGSVFLITLPLALVAFVLAAKTIPSGVGESDEPVDNLAGIISILMVAAVVLSINFAAEPDSTTAAISLGIAGLALVVAFFIRQARSKTPLYDLHYARRSTFWVAAVAGMIVFGTLMGAMFVGQQYLQNVLEYSTLQSGLTIVPAAVVMVLVAPRSAKIIESKGSRFTLLVGYLLCLAGFLAMLLLWDENTSFWGVGIAYVLIGAGVGLAGTPASHSLTSSVPVRKVGMASATADLQRDLGGAIMQSILGAFLTAGYAREFSSLISGSSSANQVTEQTESELTRSFSSAAEMAERYPQYSDQIIEAARTSFLKGDEWAFAVGVVAIVIGAVLVWFFFPSRQEELDLLASYAREDDSPAPAD
jgi:DHA2 family multidrug resistance protein-like MFS transporter